jgi:aspartyl-tRNA(Asn)/glutamyl-tRNA(Gln) amidotransferase subunit B
MTDQGSSKSDSYEKIINEKSRGYIIPEYFAELIDLISANEISSRGAKEILLDMFNTEAGNKQTSPSAIASIKDLMQKSNEGDLAPIIDDIISKNPKAITEFKAGKTASLQFLIGQAMKATKGSANPGILSKLFLEKLK